MLKDLGHPYADGKAQYDITFENVQAGERTSHLFRLANFNDALVVGTGDLSELALGWSTYGVGDHMSHYNVNASVPKTLIQHLVRWVAESQASWCRRRRRCCSTSSTPRSAPSWCPAALPGSRARAPRAMIGPYDLHDFFLYYTLRFGFAPSKVAFLAHAAWHDAARRRLARQARRCSARPTTWPTIKRHLRSFVWRFFKTSQFKRSCVPNAPKVGSGGSLSPRGDWRAPSDGEASAWLAELERIPEA